MRFSLSTPNVSWRQTTNVGEKLMKKKKVNSLFCHENLKCIVSRMVNTTVQ